MYQDTRNNRYLNNKQRSKSYKVLQVLEDLRSDLRSSGGIPASGGRSFSDLSRLFHFGRGWYQVFLSRHGGIQQIAIVIVIRPSWYIVSLQELVHMSMGYPPPPPSSLYALYESGPVLLSMCAFFRLGPAAKFLTRTLSPSANCLSFFVLSCCIFCDNCWVCTRCLMSRRMRSSRIRQRRLNSNSAGVTPVVVCGVDLYANKNRLSLVCTLPGDRSSFFSPS